VNKYNSLFKEITISKPEAVFLGGDLLPGPRHNLDTREFIQQFLFMKMKESRQNHNTEFYLIMGNDDRRIYEEDIIKECGNGIFYMHKRCIRLNVIFVVGYSHIPPTPFRLKDWERYDVSRYIGPGDLSPEAGARTVDVEPNKIKYSTISRDLDELASLSPPEKTIFLFHSPPYHTSLDRADLDGKTIDHVPLDVHIGSIAIKRFIEKQKPMLTLHGHVHESVRITGDWKEQIGSTYSFGAAHDGGELAIVYFDTARLDKAERKIIPIDL